MLAKLSIRAKIVAAFCVIIIVATGSGLFSIRQMEIINQRAIDIQSHWLKSVRLLGEMRAWTLTYRGLVRAHILASDAAGKSAMDKNYDLTVEELDNAFAAYDAMPMSEDGRALYQQFRDARKAYFDGTQEVLNASRKGDESLAQKLHGRIIPLSLKADEFLGKGIQLDHDGAEQAGRSAADTFSAAYRLVLLGLGLTITIGLLTAYVLTVDVSRGIARYRVGDRADAHAQ